MDKRADIIKMLNEQGLMPLFFHADPNVCTDLLKVLYDAGVRIVEFTNRGEKALENFALMKACAVKDYPDLYLGAGTIKNADDANKFIDAGADFLVSPALAEDVLTVAQQHNRLWIPGCMTPTEILRAENMGLHFVKIFPGNVLGTAFISAIRELFPKMSFMPTGGVETSEQNLLTWFDAGVTAVGMGSKLIDVKSLVDKDYSRISENTKSVLETIKIIKKKV